MARRIKLKNLEVRKPDGTTSPVPALVGKSAYDFAKDGGYTGTEEEFAKKLGCEIPTKNSQLENDSGYINKNVDDLRNYYNKSSSYSKEETNALVSNIPKFARKVVTTLPEMGEPDTLYLLQIEGTNEANPNMFEEWIWEGKWELLGSQNINLVDYVKKSEISAAFNELMQSIIRVGYVYTSYSAENPTDVFGFGTWERIKDTFLLAAGDTYEPNTTGGETTHQLVPDELPKLGGYFTLHGTTSSVGTVLHTAGEIAGYGKLLSVYGEPNTARKDGGTTKTDAGSIDGVAIQFGGNVAHNNMPPYETVYVWKRIS